MRRQATDQKKIFANDMYLMKDYYPNNTMNY